MSRLVILLALGVCLLSEVRAGGMLQDPISRSGVWRLPRFKNAPRNEADHSTNCGGVLVFKANNRGKCGPCGDDFSLPVPRPNENGGTYGQGRIVRKYEEGQMMKMVVNLADNKRGQFTFALCNLTRPTDVETEECFDRWPLKVSGRSGELADSFDVDGLNGQSIKITGILPKGLVCDRCVLRWQYVAANSWGRCEDNSESPGCGKQEMYRNCADISIL